MQAIALSGPSGAINLGPVAPSPKSHAFPPTGQKLHSASLRHVSLEQRHEMNLELIITIKRTKDLNYFSLCALHLFNTRVSQFELNY